MTTLIAIFVVAVLASFFCSITEAMLYSLPWSFVDQLRRSGRPAGQVLFRLRVDIEKPIAAILTLNTVANAAGATLVGAAAVQEFGSEFMGPFAVLFTAVVLVVGELIPKTLGVAHARQLAPYLVQPLQWLIWLLLPIIWISGLIVRSLRSRHDIPQTTEDDIRAVVSLSLQSGRIQPSEELTIRNVLDLDQKTVREIMTPRMVIFSLPIYSTVAEAKDVPGLWHYSRIPVFDKGDTENVVGLVYRRDVLRALADDRHAMCLGELMRPVRFVVETLTLDRLLPKFLQTRVHLFVVLDEYGGIAGVVSLEDVLEEMLGREIVDETDAVEDLRELARRQREQLTQSR
ncbi:HlyC/CorC family transporter [Desulfovibrionales bacterium]